MESLSQIFSPFDDLEIICEEHDLPCIGLCSYYLCKDKTKFLCMFGDYPYYLSKINNKLSFEDNIKELLFNENSILLKVPELVLSNSSREQGFYNSILMALAGKKKGLTEISNIMNEEVTKVNKYIKTLTEAEIIIKRETYNSKRQTNYYILDPVLRFYYKFLLINIEKIEAGYGQMLYERLKASGGNYGLKLFHRDVKQAK